MRTNTKRVRLVLSLGIAVAVLGWPLGCRRDERSKPAAAQKELLLYCGAGIRPPVDELAQVFGREQGVKIAIDYAGSEVLLSKIKLSRKGDLYMPGDKHYLEQAAAQGLLLADRSVCYLVPTILVAKGNPQKIGGLRDLLKPGIKLGLGDAKACAVGQVSKKIFEKSKIPWAQVEKNLVFQSLTVNELGLQIKTRALDAVIVWDAVACYYAADGDEVPLPAEQNVTTTVNVGILQCTAHKELAEKFVEFAASARGREIFRKYHYRVDPPP